MKKKLVSLLLAVTTAMSMGAAPMAVFAEEGTEVAAEDEELGDYDARSAELYESELGDFYSVYEAAKAEVDNLSKRYAMMAVAEAKLLESGVMLPTTTRGGNYAINRVAPHTTDYALWGNDADRFHQVISATEFIKAEDVKALREKWNELKGTGTYEQAVKDYLTEKGYTLKDTYTIGYTADPVTWDILGTSRAVDNEAIVNTFDGLLEYDVEGTLQPALAESYEVSEDGLTYTFHLRQGVEWVDAQGRKVADVVADDFVAGMQHMMDAQAGLESLVEGIIKNAAEYNSGEVTDFSEVGVKALDDYTLEYTMEAPIPYFDTMLGYSIFAPMSRAYYTSQGGKFGMEFDSSAADYNYGKDPNTIAYCGPYVVTNATEKNTIVFKANESYWNKDNINVKTLTWMYNDGTDVTKAYNDAKAGTIDGAGLNTSTVETAKADGLFDEYAFHTDTNSTSYMNFHNINRAVFANVNDDTTAQSPKSEDDIARTAAAMLNVHFRRALCLSVDRAAYNAQKIGEELKLENLRNSYVPATFVALSEDTAVDINGTETTFPAGTLYGAIMQAQLDADAYPITVFDPEADGGAGSGDGFDGWYNPEAAVAELDTAIEELAAEGVVVDAENPIYIDMPYPSSMEVYNNTANAYKQSVEAALGGKVLVNLVDGVNADGWYYAGYLTDYGYEANYDVYDLSGWSPDFGDPSSYLDTFLPDYSGYMIKCIGLY